MTNLRQHLVSLLRGNGRLLVRFGIVSAGRTALAMSGILLIQEFLAGVLGEGGGPAAELAEAVGSATALWIVAGLLVGSYVGASLCKYDSLVVEQRIVRRVELRIMERLVTHLLSLSVAFFERQERGDLIHAIRQDVARLRTVLVSLLSMIVEGMLAVGLLVTALLISPWTLAVMLVLLVAFFPLYVVAKRTGVQSGEVRQAGYVLYDIILQFLHGIRIIKVYRGEKAEARSAVDKTRKYFDELVKMVRVESLAQVIMESFAGFSLVLVVIVGGFQVLDGSMGWPALMAFLMAMAAVHRPLNQIGARYMQIQRFSAAIQRIDQLLDERPEVCNVDDPEPFPPTPPALSCENVGFSRDGVTILEHLTFDVKAGDMVGIVGPSGAGKTTLLNLVARYYDPTSGRVTLDGRDLREYRVEDYYQSLAIVTQEPFLFSGTVRDNIHCGRADATDSEVEAAAVAAGIHDEIAALSEGYETVVGVGGRGLSVGQAQRLNVARAILKHPRVLLLDEATSSLDSIAEGQVQNSLAQLMHGPTTLIVAHRLSTLRKASRIIVLDKGRCIGMGTHEELMRGCPTYYEMWVQQNPGSKVGSAEMQRDRAT